MNKTRPVNLDLGTLKFPVMAIASILHRVSGIVLFLMMPMMLYFLHLSLNSASSFVDLQMMLANPGWKVLLWGFSAALAYHLVAGIRHLLMDLGLGEHLHSGRMGAIIAIVVSVILTVLLGIWIW